MEKVSDPQNFRFCAIPQVMAAGTLALCYNNPKVFTGELLTAVYADALVIAGLLAAFQLSRHCSSCAVVGLVLLFAVHSLHIAKLEVYAFRMSRTHSQPASSCFSI